MTQNAPPQSNGRLGLFERFLSLWVVLCMAAGVAMGKLLPDLVQSLRSLEFGTGSQINVPIAVLIWLMITPMMMKVDFGSIRDVGRKPAGLVVTLVVNWLVKPFSMALLAWAFFRLVFAAFITPSEADQYIAGCIILAAAPCTAMVFVWSHLTNGDPAYTLVQVSVNDLIAGQVHFMIDSVSAALSHIQAGRVRALAVTSLQRNAALPQVPTLAEIGVSGLEKFEAVGWAGLVGPAATRRFP